MTCIVGLADGKTVTMGADSMVSDGLDKLLILEGKLFRIDDMLFGGCGSLRTMQALRYGLALPTRTIDQSDETYLVSYVVPAIADTLKDAKLLSKSGNMRGPLWLLLGYRGALFTVGRDLCVLRCPGVAADGCGRDYAYGSLYSSTGDPVKRLTLALEAAAHHSAFVGPPFYFETLPGGQ